MKIEIGEIFSDFYFLLLCATTSYNSKKTRFVNMSNRGLVSAPKAKQKRARRLFFVWYSRWESNPERPLRRGLLYPFNYGSISCYPAGNTSSLRSFAALLVPPQAVGFSSEGGRLKIGNSLNVLYFTTFRAKRQLFSRGKFESAPRRPDRAFCRKISFKHLTMRREYV